MQLKTSIIYKAVYNSDENTVVFYERPAMAPVLRPFVHFWVHVCQDGTVVVKSNDHSFSFSFNPDTGLNPIAAVIIASIAIEQAQAAKGSEPDDAEMVIV